MTGSVIKIILKGTLDLDMKAHLLPGTATHPLKALHFVTWDMKMSLHQP